MEKMLPRNIENGDDFMEKYPWLFNQSTSDNELTGDKAFMLADINALNKVSLKFYDCAK